MQVSGGSDKTLVDFTSAGGIVKTSATGVPSIATPGTDYLTGSSTNALTNKTIDATGTGNSITNLATTNFASGVVTTTVNASSTATQIPTALSVNTAITAALASTAKPMGGIDCAGNPNYPAANVGDFYRVTNAGFIGGASGTPVQVGDELHCYVTGVAGTQAAVGSNWTVVQANADQATATTLGLTTYATSVEAENRTLSTKAVTPASLVNFASKANSFVFGDGVSSAINVYHGMNSLKLSVQIYNNSNLATEEFDVSRVNVNTVQISTGGAPIASNGYTAVITPGN